MDEIIVTALIGGIILLVLAMRASRVAYHTQKSVGASIAELPEFSCDHEVFGVGYYGLAIDEKRLKFCLIDKSQKPPLLKVVQIKDVLSCEIIEDGNSVVSTNRGSQLGGALVGGLAFGGVGALAGALSGKKKTIGTATNLALQLTINDTERPIHTIRFIIGETKKDYLYSGILHTARRWHSLIAVIMKRAAVEIDSSTKYMQAPLHSVADELQKLADLLKMGLLSEAEFAEQKAKLLGRGHQADR